MVKKHNMTEAEKKFLIKFGEESEETVKAIREGWTLLAEEGNKKAWVTNQAGDVFLETGELGEDGYRFRHIGHEREIRGKLKKRRQRDSDAEVSVGD